MSGMAVEVKKLDVRVGDLAEIEGRRYDVVPDRQGGVALEPAITRTVEEPRAGRGARPVSREELEELFGDLPSDGRAESWRTRRASSAGSPTPRC
jgi:hypothetical protein